MLGHRIHGAVRLAGIVVQEVEEQLDLVVYNALSGERFSFRNLTTFDEVRDLKWSWYWSAIRRVPEPWPNRMQGFWPDDYTVYLDNNECEDGVVLDRRWEQGRITVLVRGDDEP